MVRWRSRYSRWDIGYKGCSLLPGRSFRSELYRAPVVASILSFQGRGASARIAPDRGLAGCAEPERWKWRTPWRIALFWESASPPRPAEQGVWSASTARAQGGGYIFAAAPNAATSDAAIRRPHSMPVPTRVPSVTPSCSPLNLGRTGSTSTPRRSSSAARGFRIPSPDHRSSRHQHRQTRYRQTGESTYTGSRGAEPIAHRRRAGG